MTKILTIGDIHTKDFIINYVDEVKDEYDKIIFLGDYVDDWNSDDNKMVETLKEVIKFKRKNFDKVILLYGNHDLSYVNPKCRCSGFRKDLFFVINNLFILNKDCFQVAYQYKNWLWSHAGLTSIFFNRYKKEFHKYSGKDLAETLNNMWDSSFQSIFGHAGAHRGGHGYASPLWADYSELIAHPKLGVNQIVGHSPQKRIKKHTANKNIELYFCDTFSTYRDGTYYGDGSVLVWNIGETEILDTYLV